MDQYAAGGAGDVTLTLDFPATPTVTANARGGRGGARLHKPAAALDREQIAQAEGRYREATGMEEITRMVRVAYDPAAQETIEDQTSPHTSWEDCGPLMHEAGWSHYSHDSS